MMAKKKKGAGHYTGLRPDVYAALRKQGASKEKAAKIANAAGAGTLASWGNKKRKGKKAKK
jgi:hypothetical protein